MSTIFGVVSFAGEPISTAKLNDIVLKINLNGKGSLITELAGDLAFLLNSDGISILGDDDVHLLKDERERFILADAIIDNAEELTRELSLLPKARGIAETGSIISKSFNKWGNDFFEKLYGDFSVSIYDSRNKTLVLGRDHVGSRPLHWAQRSSIIAFSTNPSWVAEFLWADVEIDDGMVADFLMDPSYPRSPRFFKGVQAVPPGAILRIGPTLVPVLAKWWDPFNVSDRRYRDSQQYVEAFRSIAAQAVRDRLQAQCVVGSHLSGGVDSTIVTRLAAAQLRASDRPLNRAYTWSPGFSDEFPDLGSFDERHVINSVANLENIELVNGAADGRTFRNFFKRPIEVEGVGDLMDELAVLKKARVDGVRVMLSGWGGDEGFSSHGIGFLSTLLARGQLLKAFSALRALSFWRRNPRVLSKNLWRYGILPLAPDWLFFRLQHLDRVYEGGCFLNPDLLHLFSHRTPVRLYSDPTEQMYSQMSRGHLGNRMETWSHWGSEFGVTYRYPLTDRRLFDFILQCPPEVFFGDGRHRFFVNEAFGDLLVQPVSDHDPANEAFRLKNRAVCWDILEREALENPGYFQCDWLNDVELRDAILAKPKKMDSTHIPVFARISAAMRVLEMWKRHRA